MSLSRNDCLEWLGAVARSTGGEGEALSGGEGGGIGGLAAGVFGVIFFLWMEGDERIGLRRGFGVEVKLLML